MSDDSNNWCTIESDPGVFSCLIESFGVQKVQLTELWSLDDDSLANMTTEYGNVYGLIFLFKWQPGQQTSSDDGQVPLEGDAAPSDLFFAKQTTQNACATQAILSVLLNSASSSISSSSSSTSTNESHDMILGEKLTTFKSFVSSFPPDLKGEAIGSNDDIRTAHNSFARKESFLVESKQRIATENDDVFHFIAYVPHTDGVVYELDGLQAGPISCGSYKTDKGESTTAGGERNDMDWLRVARAAIQNRIEKYAASEIKFNLMGITTDKRAYLQSKIQSLTETGINVEDESIQDLTQQISVENDIHDQWKEENERRRHNYVPFCVELIRALVGSEKYEELKDKAKERADAKRMQAMQNKLKMSGMSF